MARKSEQLQIRVTAAQKAKLKQLARRAGQDVSTYVLSVALPAGNERFQRAVAALADESNRRFGLAEVSDVLTSLSGSELERIVADIDLTGLSPFAQNYLAATVESVCVAQGVKTPAWAQSIEPLDAPWFATPLRSLRTHLLRRSPVAFRRRGLFIDAGPEARV